MNRTVKITLVLLSVVILLTVVATWYKYEFSMEVVEAYQVNSPDLERKLLIATQGSEFKDAITRGIVDHYKSDSIFINVIDISSLNDINPNDYIAIIIMHTWENWKPPIMVKQFIERTLGDQYKIVVLTTSGEGTYKMKEVDALTGESNLKETDSFIEKIITRLDSRLESKN